MYLSCFLFSEIVEPLGSSSSVAGNMLTDLGLDVMKTEGEETSIGLCDVQLSLASEVNRIILKIKLVVNEDTLRLKQLHLKRILLSFNKSASFSDNNTF